MPRFLLVLGLVCGLAGPAHAQVPVSAPSSEAQVHRLEIRDGVLYHNGNAIPASAIPPGVDLSGVEPMSMDYSGDVTPAVEVDGRVFAFADDRLIEVQEAAGEGGEAQAFGIFQSKATGRSTTGASQQRQRRAEQEYMNSLSETDRALYERLMREREMETEALRLAQRYQQAATDAERSTIQQQLREKLGAMFDLKQENRREEVRQMEVALETLRERMNERRAMREEIVEHRMKELLAQ